MKYPVVLKKNLALLGILFLTGCSEEPKVSTLYIPIRGPCSTEAPEFTFTQVSDTHVGNNNGDDQYIDVITLINGLQPDFTVATGDLSDHTAHDTSRGIVELTEYARLTDLIEVLHYSLPGNHDLGYRKDDPLNRGLVWSKYEDNVAAYTSIVGPLNQEFEYKGYQFILIDDNPLYSSGPAYITDDQLAWIDGLLNKGLPTIIMGHVQLLYQGIFSSWGKDAARLVNLIESHGNVVAFLNGHMHTFTMTKKKNTLYVTAPDLKVPGRSKALVYKVFSNRLEICAASTAKGIYGQVTVIPTNTD